MFGITIVVILATVAASYYAWQNPIVYDKWLMIPYRIKRNGEYQRMITSGFIHLDSGHLFFNMFTLYFFGEVVEKTLDAALGNGIVWFLILYILGIVLSDLPTVFKHRDNRAYSSLGASGGVSAILFAAVALNPFMPICPYGITFLCMPGFLWAGLYLLYTAYSTQNSRDNISHEAHLYGSLFGLIFVFSLVPDSFNHFLNSVSTFLP